MSAVDDLGDFYNVEMDGLEFTADKQSREWSLRPDDNWPAVEAAAAKVGIDPEAFWKTYEPRLNALVGWAVVNRSSGHQPITHPYDPLLTVWIDRERPNGLVFFRYDGNGDQGTPFQTADMPASDDAAWEKVNEWIG